MNKLSVLKLKIISKENPKMDPLHVQNQPSYDQRFTIVKKKFTTVFNYERVIKLKEAACRRQIFSRSTCKNLSNFSPYHFQPNPFLDEIVARWKFHKDQAF